MNKYQVIMPTGDIAAVAADRMENVEGDLKFFVGSAQVGEFRYWQAWNLVGAVDVPVTPTPFTSATQPVEAYVQDTINRLIDPHSGRS